MQWTVWFQHLWVRSKYHWTASAKKRKTFPNSCRCKRGCCKIYWTECTPGFKTREGGRNPCYTGKATNWILLFSLLWRKWSLKRSKITASCERMKKMALVTRPAPTKSERRKLESRGTRDIGNELRPAGVKLEESTKTTTYLWIPWAVIDDKYKIPKILLASHILRNWIFKEFDIEVFLNYLN